MKDFLGQTINEGDYVAALFSDNTTPGIFYVYDFTPKKIKVCSINELDADIIMKYPQQVIKVDEKLVDALRDIIPLDAIGAPLEVGDYVFGSGGSYIDPVIYEIESFGTKFAKLKSVYSPEVYSRQELMLTSDLVKIDKRILTMHLLTKSNEDAD